MVATFSFGIGVIGTSRAESIEVAFGSTLDCDATPAGGVEGSASSSSDEELLKSVIASDTTIMSIDCIVCID